MKKVVRFFALCFVVCTLFLFVGCNQGEKGLSFNNPVVMEYNGFHERWIHESPDKISTTSGGRYYFKFTTTEDAIPTKVIAYKYMITGPNSSTSEGLEVGNDCEINFYRTNKSIMQIDVQGTDIVSSSSLDYTFNYSTTYIVEVQININVPIYLFINLEV